MYAEKSPDMHKIRVRSLPSDRKMCQNPSDAQVYQEKDHLKEIHPEASEHDLKYSLVVAQVGG